MIRKVLTLGVSAMALAALSVAAAGCTGGEDDDDATGGPGGRFNVMVSTNGAVAGNDEEIGNYAEFWTDVNEEPTSQRDIPLGVCVPVTDSTSFVPTYAAPTTVTAVGSSTTLTYEKIPTDDFPDVYYNNALHADAPAGIDYTASVDGETLGTISVPDLPNPISIAMGTRNITWQTAGADDAFVIVVNGNDPLNPWICHVSDTGAFNFGTVTGLTTVTAGLATVTLVNYGEADWDGRSVSLIGQAGDPGNEIYNYEFYDPN